MGVAIAGRLSASTMRNGFHPEIRLQHPNHNHDLRRVCKDLIKTGGITVLWLGVGHEYEWKDVYY
jgi:hypothetical protein